jgi:hypothetical protein
MTILELLVLRDPSLFASPLDEEFIPITQIPPLHLLEDVLTYKYWIEYKIILQDLHYKNYGKWLKILSKGITDEKINELLKRVC